MKRLQFGTGLILLTVGLLGVGSPHMQLTTQIANAADSPTPPLLQRDLFFADPDIAGAQLSPDGQFLSFQKPLDGERTLLLQNDEQIALWTTDLAGNVQLAYRQTIEGGNELLAVGDDGLTPVYTCKIEEEQLITQATGQPVFPLYPISETRFLAQVADITIQFDVSAEETVGGLTLYQAGQEFFAPKVN